MPFDGVRVKPLDFSKNAALNPVSPEGPSAKAPPSRTYSLRTLVEFVGGEGTAEIFRVLDGLPNTLALWERAFRRFAGDAPEPLPVAAESTTSRTEATQLDPKEALGESFRKSFSGDTGFELVENLKKAKVEYDRATPLRVKVRQPFPHQVLLEGLIKLGEAKLGALDRPSIDARLKVYAEKIIEARESAAHGSVEVRKKVYRAIQESLVKDFNAAAFHRLDVLHAERQASLRERASVPVGDHVTRRLNARLHRRAARYERGARVFVGVRSTVVTKVGGSVSMVRGVLEVATRGVRRSRL